MTVSVTCAVPEREESKKISEKNIWKTKLITSTKLNEYQVAELQRKPHLDTSLSNC